MKQLTVTIYVSPSAAAVAGRSIVGEVALALSDADLATLTEGQRASLAEYLRSGAASLRGIEVAEATLGTLATLLDERAAVAASSAAREAADEAADEAALRAELAALAGCPIEAFYALNRQGWLAPRSWQDGRKLIELLGRQEEGAAWLRDAAQSCADRKVAQEAAEAAAEAARAAKIASDRAELRAFLAHHLDEVAIAWFDALEDPSAARAEVRKILVRLLRPAIGGEGPQRYLRPEGSRVGHSVDPVTDLDVYRQIVALAASVAAAVAADPALENVTAEVENITIWRVAEDGEDGDEDGEVAEVEWIRIRCEVGGVAVSLYTR